MATENRLREKLHDIFDRMDFKCTESYKFADAILQSPEVRVELVEPRYQLEGNLLLVDTQPPVGMWRLRVQFNDLTAAKEYCDWLNSKGAELK